MRHNRPIHVYVVVIAERQELPFRELGAIVRDDRIWDHEPVDYVGEELHGLLGFDFGDGPSLDPLGELVNRYQQVGEAPRRFLQGPTRSSPHTAKGHVMGMVCRA